MKKLWLISGFAISLIIVVACLSCVYEPLEEDLQTRNIYPITNNLYDIGSPLLNYQDGYFMNLYLNGVAITGSQWVNDANGINYSSGSIGINTPSEANRLVRIYSNDGVKNNPVLHVGDNSASAGATGVHIQMAGAKTAADYALRIDNSATSNTGGINKGGIYISTSSVWNGIGSNNIGIHVDVPTGGTNNYAAILDGITDLSDNPIQNISKLNLTDPTELTISGGAVTVTQSYHTVDTEGDAPLDELVTINGGAIGDTLTLAGANDAREVKILRTGNIRFQPDHLVEGFSFASPTGTSGTFYAAGFYTAPAADANLNQGSPTITIGSANTPHASHVFIVAGGAGTTDVGTVSIVVSGVSIDSNGVRTPADSETIVADITTMALNSYYQTTKRWLGVVTYTLTPAGGATTYAADFNYGKAVYDSFDERSFRITKLEIMGRAGASDTGFDIQLLHHKTTGWTYNAAAFVPGTAYLCSLANDYSTDNDLVINERFYYDREIGTNINGTSNEGFLVKIITTSNKAVEFMDISVYAEAIPNDEHLKNTNQAISLIYNGTNWMEQ